MSHIGMTCEGYYYADVDHNGYLGLSALKFRGNQSPEHDCPMARRFLVSSCLAFVNPVDHRSDFGGHFHVVLLRHFP